MSGIKTCPKVRWVERVINEQTGKKKFILQYQTQTDLHTSDGVHMTEYWWEDVPVESSKAPGIYRYPYGGPHVEPAGTLATASGKIDFGDGGDVYPTVTIHDAPTDDELIHKGRMVKFCDNCGSQWVDNGINSGCSCKRIGELNVRLWKLNNEAQKWKTMFDKITVAVKEATS